VRNPRRHPATDFRGILAHPPTGITDAGPRSGIFQPGISGSGQPHRTSAIPNGRYAGSIQIA